MDDDPVRIEVLGPVRVGASGATPGPKQALVLGALALRRRGVSVDELIEVLWPTGSPSDPRTALQIHVSRLRRLLAEVDASIALEGRTYRLLAQPGTVDVHRFERLAEEGLAADGPEVASRALAAALASWSGPPLDGAADDTELGPDVDRLHDLHLRALAARIDADLALGRHAEVVGEAVQATRDHPLHEGFRRAAMLALYRCGRAAEALSSFEHHRVVVADRLGADPSPMLRELHTRILRQDAELTLLGSVGALQVWDAAAPLSSATTSLAVLPFEVVAEGGDEAGADAASVLAAGLHVDLLTEISRIPDVTVISRHSVLGYGRGHASVDDVVHDLGVAAVVVGSVRIVGDRFRLTVALLDAGSSTQGWAESYDHLLTPGDLLSVQQDLARDIAASLSRELGPTGATATTSMEAYRLVVEGRMHFDRKSEAGFALAADAFERAADLDPSYVAAWTGLASTLALTADYGYGDRASLLKGAGVAIDRAAATAPDDPELHEARGLVAEVTHDAPAALAAYERAIHVRPGQADAHSWHAWIGLTVGRAEQAHASARRAVELNPLSAEAVSNLALAAVATGRAAEGLSEARRSILLSPGYTTGEYYAALALYDLGRLEEACELLSGLARVVGGVAAVPWSGRAPHAALALTHVAAGRPEEARRVLEGLDPTAFPVEAGLVQLGLGEVDRALTTFRIPARIGYGGAMLFHLHFRDVWAAAEGRLDELAAAVGRSWGVVDV